MRKLAVGAASLWAVLGCGGVFTNVEGDVRGECANDYDEDGDGWIDCEDPSCAQAPACAKTGKSTGKKATAKAAPKAEPQAAPEEPPKVAFSDVPAGGWKKNGVIYDAWGNVYACEGGGNWCFVDPEVPAGGYKVGGIIYDQYSRVWGCSGGGNWCFPDPEVPSGGYKASNGVIYDAWGNVWGCSGGGDWCLGQQWMGE